MQYLWPYKSQLSRLSYKSCGFEEKDFFNILLHVHIQYVCDKRAKYQKLLQRVAFTLHAQNSHAKATFQE